MARLLATTNWGVQLTTLSDAELLESARDGDRAALAELYIRHRGVARRVASTACRRGSDPDDLVNEAFEKVFAAVRRKTGPTDAFRAYLFVTIRRLAARHAARTKDDPYDEVPEPVVSAAHNGGLEPAERELITSAFTSLPGRWQAVLWHTAVEGRHPREVAEALGISSNAVSALAYRAREKLRQAYLQAHLQAAPRPSCEPHRSTLGAFVRGGLGPRERMLTEKHLLSCSSCRSLVNELDGVNHLLARAVLPMFLVSHLGEAIAGGADVAGLAGTADLLSLPPADQAADLAASGFRRLLNSVADLGTLTKVGGGAAATALVIGGLGAGWQTLEHIQKKPKAEVVVEAASADPPERTPAPHEPNPEPEVETIDVQGGQRCFDGTTAGSNDSDGTAGDQPAASEATEEDQSSEDAASDDGIALLSLDLGGLLDTVTDTVGAEGAELAIENVSCDQRDDGEDLVLTVDTPDTEDATTTTSTTSPPVASVETGDVVPEVLPEVLPDVDAGVSLEIGDEIAANLDTNLAELCEHDAERQDLICTLDSSLGGAITGTVSDSNLGIEAGGPGGNILRVELREGDAVVDVKLLNLLP